MYLSTQAAARRLGVAPHTLRRWAASGIIPCVRTAGGHRRFRQEDVDELQRQSRHTGVREATVARERELDTLLDVLVTLTGQLELTELLADIACQATRLLDCQACVISAFDEASGMVRPLAEFDRAGQRLPDFPPYTIDDEPTIRGVLRRREPAVLTASDRSADPAETSELRRWNIRTVLLMPLANRDGAIGLLEAIDRERERRFSRQEMRIARAIAASASVALHSAQLFARQQLTDADALRFETAVERTTARLGDLCGAASGDDALRAAAAVVCEAFDAPSAVARWDDRAQLAGGELGAGPAGAGRPRRTAAGTDPGPSSVLACRMPCGDGFVDLSATLHDPPGPGLTGLARMIAALAAWRIGDLPVDRAP